MKWLCIFLFVVVVQSDWLSEKDWSKYRVTMATFDENGTANVCRKIVAARDACQQQLDACNHAANDTVATLEAEIKKVQLEVQLAKNKLELSKTNAELQKLKQP